MNIQVLGRDSRGYFYHTGEKSARNVAISRDEYERILVTAVSQKVEYRRHSWQSVYTIHFDNGFDYQTPQDAPKTHETRRVVLAHHIDGKTETDADWLARQAELADYAATVDAASYRQGV